MKSKLAKNVGSLAVGLLLWSVFSTVQADFSAPSKRTGAWEFAFSASYVDGETIAADGGSSLTTSGDLGWTFGFAYNFSEKLALGFEFGWNSVSYSATRVEDNGLGTRSQFGGVLDTSGTRFNLTYNFLAKRFTPYVTANVGWVWVDSNIPSGPTVGTCFYDPWYGYVCSGYTPTYTATEFTYGASLGLRFDATNQVFLRGGVGQQWVDFSNATGVPSFTNYRIEMGFLF